MGTVYGIESRKARSLKKKKMGIVGKLVTVGRSLRFGLGIGDWEFLGINSFIALFQPHRSKSPDKEKSPGANEAHGAFLYPVKEVTY